MLSIIAVTTAAVSSFLPSTIVTVPSGGMVFAVAVVIVRQGRPADRHAELRDVLPKPSDQVVEPRETGSALGERPALAQQAPAGEQGDADRGVTHCL
jgi:hypothetical protein